MQSTTRHRLSDFLRSSEYPLILCILFAATFFRLHRLDEVPPGMTHDEGSVGFFVRQVAVGEAFEIDAPYGYANEPFTRYTGAIVMWLVGPTDWALRLHQAFWGVMLTLTTFLWGRAAFGGTVGLGGAALVGVSFWPQMTSRFALNSNPAPALLTGAIWLLWIALFRDPLRLRLLAWAGFALALAGALMTYEAARGAWLALPAFWLYLRIVGQQRRMGQFALALACGTALTLPYLLNPAAWGRTAVLSEPLTSAAHGDFNSLVRNALEALGTLFLKGDPFIVYNIPGRPVLDPITAVLFVGGVLFCLWHWRRPACAFVILWFGAGFAPAAVIGAFTMTLHAITTQAVVFTLPALMVELLARYFTSRISRFTRIAFALLVVLTAVLTFRDYFDGWGNSTETRAAYFANFHAVTAYLHTTPYSGSVTLSSPFPGLPHDPFVADLRVRRRDVDLRWFDAREALVFPQVRESLLVLPANARPDPVFIAQLPMNTVVRHIVRETDVDPYFETLIWQPQTTLAAWLADGTLTTVDPPANFGGALALLAASLSSPSVLPGETVQTITVWQVLDPTALGPRAPVHYAPEAMLFLHVLDADGNYMAGSDRLHAPAWNWHPGDSFAQIHRIALPPDMLPGEYPLRIGLYTLPDVVRLLRLDAEADTVEIGRIQVVPP